MLQAGLPPPSRRKLSRMTLRPLLAVDVDGVISLFGFEEPPDRSVARFELIDGMVHCISTAAGERLERLSDLYDLVWATGWEDRANDSLAPLLGLPELPYLSFDDREAPTLLVPTESPYGLEEAQTETLISWAKQLARERNEAE